MSGFAHIRREDIDGHLEFADRDEVEDYIRASISMSPHVGNLPEAIEVPVLARRATSIFIAEKAQ